MATRTVLSTPCSIGRLELVLGQNCDLMMHALIRLWTSMASLSRWTTIRGSTLYPWPPSLVSRRSKLFGGTTWMNARF
uniref:Uncharacterized protein n=1 Tax=Arundo donax TaxID=35708 RepID=A0A0A9CN28_ARUDO